MTETIMIALIEPIAVGGEVITELAIRRASDAELIEYAKRAAAGERNIPNPCLGGLSLEAVFQLRRGDFDRIVAAINKVEPLMLVTTKPTLN